MLDRPLHIRLLFLFILLLALAAIPAVRWYVDEDRVAAEVQRVTPDEQTLSDAAELTQVRPPPPPPGRR